MSFDDIAGLIENYIKRGGRIPVPGWEAMGAGPGNCVPTPVTAPDLEFGKTMIIALPRETQQALYEWMRNVLELRMP